MTVEELIERLQAFPGNLEVRVVQPNSFGGMQPKKAWSVKKEHDDPQDETSVQFVLIQ